jgi:hypothetical protein
LHVYWKCEDFSLLGNENIQKIMHEQIYEENALYSILAPSRI